MNQYQRNKRELLKDQCIKYVGGKTCVVCGANHLSNECYDFHHEKGSKETNISVLISRKSKMDKELKIELDKCVLLCSNCHRKVTSRLVRL